MKKRKNKIHFTRQKKILEFFFFLTVLDLKSMNFDIYISKGANNSQSGLPMKLQALDGLVGWRHACEKRGPPLWGIGEGSSLYPVTARLLKFPL